MSKINALIQTWFSEHKRKTLNFFLFVTALTVISRFGMALMYAIFIEGDFSSFITQITSVYDNNWYASIIENGYDPIPYSHDKHDAANWAFFPLSPMLMRVFTFGGIINFRYAGLIASNLFFILALTVAFKYILLRGGEAKTAVLFSLVMIFGPYSFYFTSLYTESLFMLLTLSYLYLMKKEKYIAMGLAGALLSATRVTGALTVLAPFIFIIYRHVKEKRGGITVFIKQTLSNHRLVLGACLTPLGLFAYMTYLYFYVGDPFAFMNIQKAWGRGNIIDQIIYYTFGPPTASVKLSASNDNFFGALFDLISSSSADQLVMSFFYIVISVVIILVLIGHIRRHPYETVPYLAPSLINVLSLGVINLARYSIGTGIFGISMIESISRRSKWVRITCYVFLFAYSVFLQYGWFVGHPLTIG